MAKASTKGRPEKPKAERRRHRLEVKVNDRELRELEQRCGEAGLKRATFMRRAALGRELCARGDGTYGALHEAARPLLELRRFLEERGYDEAAEKVQGVVRSVGKVMRRL